MGCGEGIVRFIMFIVNFVFAVSGLALLVLGVVLQLGIEDWKEVVQDIQFAPISAIIIGALVFLVSFFGCCGALRGSNCLLVSYAVCMIVLAVGTIALASYIFVFKGEAASTIANSLNEAFTSQYLDVFHLMETTLQCCGTTGPTAYGILNITNLPPSCCDAGVQNCNMVNAHQTGCITMLTQYINTYSVTIGSILIAVAAVEVVAVVFALCLANHASNRNRRSRY